MIQKYLQLLKDKNFRLGILLALVLAAGFGNIFMTQPIISTFVAICAIWGLIEVLVGVWLKK